MSFGAFLKKRLMEYFIITTCVTAAIAILGMALDPAARFGYESLFSPLIFGALSLPPSLVLYARRELTLRQTLRRKALYIVLLEATLLAFGLWAGVLRGPADGALFALTVFLVYLAVNLIGWLLGRREADEINKTLKLLQGRE